MPPEAGNYSGTSGDDEMLIEFSVDESGVLRDFTTISYCLNPTGGLITHLLWAEGPDIEVEVGVPFDHSWRMYDNTVLYELSGIINADGTANGVMDGHYTRGDDSRDPLQILCLGIERDWNAAKDSSPDPPPVFTPTIETNFSNITETTLADTGLEITGTGFPAEISVTLIVDGIEIATDVTDVQGAVSFRYVTQAHGVGSYEVTLVSTQWPAATSFTVSADETTGEVTGEIAGQVTGKSSDDASEDDPESNNTADAEANVSQERPVALIAGAVVLALGTGVIVVVKIRQQRARS